MFDDELDRFKRIPLLRYAVEVHGYQHVPRESGSASLALRHPSTGDKIIVRRDVDGHWTYFSVRDDQDNGTIVDFVQSRGRSRNFGHIRKELRQWLGTPRPERDDWTTYTSPPPARDPRAVAEAFDAAQVADTCAYLEARGLGRETLSDPRFAGTWRLGRYGNALFAHRDDAGELTGFEIENRGFASFSPGGTKTAWQSNTRPDDHALVITEGAIDALSYHQRRRGAGLPLPQHRRDPRHAAIRPARAALRCVASGRGRHCCRRPGRRRDQARRAARSARHLAPPPVLSARLARVRQGLERRAAAHIARRSRGA